MERAVAIKKLGKLLGKKLGYRINTKAPTQEEKAAAAAELPAAVDERRRLREQKEERYRTILAADTEYQRLFAEHRAASDRTDHLSSITRCHKITVGVSESMFFLVKAEGDSWEEVIEKVSRKGVTK